MSTLLSDIDAFLDAHRMSPTAFGTAALSDKNFVRDLKAERPRRVWPETERKVRRFMATYRPEMAA